MKAYFGGLLLLLPTLVIPAEDAFPTREDENDSLSVQIGFFDQSDGEDNLGGNPHIDEEETVYEAIIVYDKQRSETDRVQYRFLGDLVSSASITRETNPQFQVLQSHPSGNKRGEIGASWSRDEGDRSFGFNGSFSAEYHSYFSLGLGANYGRSLADDNTQLRLGYQGYYDTFQHKDFNGVNGEYQSRRSHTLDLGLTQVLTPTTLLDLSLSHTRQSGVLGTTWHSVFVNGRETSAQLPDTRERNAATVRYRQALGDRHAVELGYRWYDDSWNLSSDTYELTFSSYVMDKRVLLEPNYRYYDQRGASHYATDFSTARTYMTSDPDLGHFSGESFGIKGTLLGTQGFANRKADISLSFDVYRRSDGVDLFWTTFGYTTRF